MKVISKKQTFTDSQGKLINYTQHYLVLDNGRRIAIKAIYKDGKQALNVIAERESE